MESAAECPSEWCGARTLPTLPRPYVLSAIPAIILANAAADYEYLRVDLNELNTDVQSTPDFGLEMSHAVADPSTMNHEILVATVIRPLANNPALQTFLPVVEKASLLLDTFPNMPLRNTELSLMQEGKVRTAARHCP